MRCVLLLLICLSTVTTAWADAPPLSRADTSLLRQVRDLLDQDDPSAARALLKTRLEQPEAGTEPPHPLFFLALGNALYMQNDPSGAYKAYAQARQGLPDDPAACRNMGLAAYALQRWEESGALLEQAYDLAPEPEPALLRQAATAWSAGGKHAQAARLMSRAMELLSEPDSDWLRCNARMQTRAGMHEKGVRPILALLEKAPYNAKLWLLLAEVETEGKRYGHAAAAMETALHLHHEPAIHDRLVRLYAGTGLPDQAARKLKKPACRKDAALLDRIAGLWARAQNPQAALETLQEAQNVSPSAARLRKMAELCYVHGLHSDAVRYFQAYLQKNAMDQDARMLLTQAALSDQDTQAAQRALQDIPKDSRHFEIARDLLRLLEPPTEN
ncbi:MAG: hypothetical protein V3573_13425 [Desulfovibrionaceae bacterium]